MIDIFKSRTIWFSIALAVLSAVGGYLGVLFPNPLVQAGVGIAVAAAVAALRVITTAPLILTPNSEK